ncbi:MAG TPA: diacylglycerol kinase family protein, partial [Candidatus Limnocylindrales bacterium]|nr:diacylglycerol kinase family protein [Candidatus Limnocylindrales bacterium]
KFIVNPIAGEGKAKSLLPKLKSNLNKSAVDYEIYITKGRLDAVEAAQSAVKDGFDIVVAVGGDGTVNEILNGLVGSDAILAAVHGGKGNDFATAVNMPRDIDAACADLLTAKVKKIDLGRVMDRYFINSVGIGFDATVANRVNRGIKPLKGVSAYIYAVFETLFTYKPVEMEITMDDEVFKLKPMLVAVGIGPAYGGGMRIVPNAIQDDGLFDICIFDQMSRLKLAYHFPKVFKGKHTNLAQAIMYRVPDIQVRSSEPLPLHMEGEILFGDQMDFTLKKHGMKVLTGSVSNKGRTNERF